MFNINQASPHEKHEKKGFWGLYWFLELDDMHQYSNLLILEFWVYM